MKQMRIVPPPRTADSWGEGHYGAPRGTRTHKGVDLNAAAGSKVLAASYGIVTKLGYPYGDDLSFRYVQITTASGHLERYFYLEPMVEDGDQVVEGEVIGKVQDLSQRYPGITSHFHFEVKQGNTFLNPELYLGESI